ncbi:uncharacterized protein LOC125504329 [Dendroctonus ponderosae]|nr:uncharacterized protein LOC125504329 [Dendroctonus ponderosae]
MIDKFSRWPEAAPIFDITADTIATTFYNTWISRYGAPRVITSDQRSQFEGELFQTLLRLFGVKRQRTTPHHLKSNGLVERWHQTLKAALMCHDSQRWTEVFSTVLFGLRTAFKQDLNSSAAELLFGAPLKVPAQINLDPIFERCDRSLLVVMIGQEFVSIKIYKPAPMYFFECRVLEPPYTGPHPVVTQINDQLYEIQVNGRNLIISTDRLKPAYQLVEDDAEPRPVRTYPGVRKKVRFATN